MRSSTPLFRVALAGLFVAACGTDGDSSSETSPSVTASAGPSTTATGPASPLSPSPLPSPTPSLTAPGATTPPPTTSASGTVTAPATVSPTPITPPSTSASSSATAPSENTGGAPGSAGGGFGASDGAGAGGGGATSSATGGSGLGGSGLGGSGLGGSGLGGASGSAGERANPGGASNGGGGNVEAYDPCPPAAEGPCRIFPLGDSITDGFNVAGGYRIELFRQSNLENKSITFVGSASNGPGDVDGIPFPRNHEGHSGYTIDDAPAIGREGVAQYVEPGMSEYEPHIVILKIGTNDLNNNFEVATAPDRLGALIDSIFEQNPDVLLLLTQIVPSRNDGLNQAVETYNEAFPELIESRVNAGRHIVLVDMYGTFTSRGDFKTSLLADDLHPSDAGYALMGQTYYDALAQYLH
jgi:lysophospholipase L1-like esterase